MSWFKRKKKVGPLHGEVYQYMPSNGDFKRSTTAHRTAEVVEGHLVMRSDTGVTVAIFTPGTWTAYMVERQEPQ